MTVKELKDFLEECDDDMEVTVLHCDTFGYWEGSANCKIREEDGLKTVCIRDEEELMYKERGF